MRKYIITLLLMILIVVIGINQANSNYQKDVLNTENKYVETIDKQEEITYNEVKNKTKPETNFNIEENDNHIIMEATADTRSIEEGTHRGITKSGTQVSRGTAAVDPDRIPLGTKLYVEGYGHAVALDIGGAIIDNRIDLYMDSREECFEFGRREVKVWIIED